MSKKDKTHKAVIYFSIDSTGDYNPLYELSKRFEQDLNVGIIDYYIESIESLKGDEHVHNENCKYLINGVWDCGKTEQH